MTFKIAMFNSATWLSFNGKLTLLKLKRAKDRRIVGLEDEVRQEHETSSQFYRLQREHHAESVWGTMGCCAKYQPLSLLSRMQLETLSMPKAGFGPKVSLTPFWAESGASTILGPFWTESGANTIFGRNYANTILGRNWGMSPLMYVIRVFLDSAVHGSAGYSGL